MKRRSLGMVIASIALLTACGGGGDGSGGAAEPTGTTETTAAPAPEESPEATPTETGSTVLKGTVGTAEDPEAFEISLTTEDGEEVTTLTAGEYTIEVSDPSVMHNFHLTGGSVDESTSVPDKEETTFVVTLEEGEYTYKCDPHPPMTGSFTVTAAA